MLDYMKAALKKTFSDLKTVGYWISASTQIIYVAYLIYALVAQTGIVYANAALLTISVSYLIFFFCTTSFGKHPDGKPMGKTVKTVCTVLKKCITLFTLGVAVYALIQTAKDVQLVPLLFTALMIVGWVLGVAFELIIRFVSNRVDLITTALEADIEQVTKPFRSVGNFFKKATGQEIEQPKEPNKHRVFLDKVVAEKKEEEKRQKIEEKQLKKEKKAEEKRQRKQLRRAKKQPLEEEVLPPPEEKKSKRALAAAKTAALLPPPDKENSGE